MLTADKGHRSSYGNCNDFTHCQPLGQTIKKHLKHDCQGGVEPHLTKYHCLFRSSTEHYRRTHDLVFGRYLLDGAVEGCVEIRRTHVVLECELPPAVLGQVKPAQK